MGGDTFQVMVSSIRQRDASLVARPPTCTTSSTATTERTLLVHNTLSTCPRQTLGATHRNHVALAPRYDVDVEAAERGGYPSCPRTSPPGNIVV